MLPSCSSSSVSSRHCFSVAPQCPVATSSSVYSIHKLSIISVRSPFAEGSAGGFILRCVAMRSNICSPTSYPTSHESVKIFDDQPFSSLPLARIVDSMDLLVSREWSVGCGSSLGSGRSRG